MKKKLSARILSYMLMVAVLISSVSANVLAADFSEARIGEMELVCIEESNANLKINKVEDGKVFYSTVNANDIFSLPTEAEVNVIAKSTKDDCLYVEYTHGANNIIDVYYPDEESGANIKTSSITTTTSITGETVVNERIEDSIVYKIKNAVENGVPLSAISGISVFTIDGTTHIYPDFSAVRTAANYVDIVIPVSESFPAYNANVVLSSSLHYSALNSYRTTRVYETRDYYIHSSTDYSGIFEIGTTVGSIASSLMTSVSWIGAILLSYDLIDVINSAEQITQRMRFKTHEDVEFWFAAEGGVYDTTSASAYVEVRCEEDWGLLSFAMLTDNASGTTYGWALLPENYPGNWGYDKNEFLQDTHDAYNRHIELYGAWTQGIGAFGE